MAALSAIFKILLSLLSRYSLLGSLSDYLDLFLNT